MAKQYQTKMQLLEVTIQKKVATARQEMQAKFDSDLNQIKQKYKQELTSMLAKPHVAEPPAQPAQSATNDEEEYYSEVEEEEEGEEEQSEL